MSIRWISHTHLEDLRVELILHLGLGRRRRHGPSLCWLVDVIVSCPIDERERSKVGGKGCRGHDSNSDASEPNTGRASEAQVVWGCDPAGRTRRWAPLTAWGRRRGQPVAWGLPTSIEEEASCKRSPTPFGEEGRYPPARQANAATRRRVPSIRSDAKRPRSGQPYCLCLDGSRPTVLSLRDGASSSHSHTQRTTTRRLHNFDSRFPMIQQHSCSNPPRHTIQITTHRIMASSAATHLSHPAVRKF